MNARARRQNSAAVRRIKSTVARTEQTPYVYVPPRRQPRLGGGGALIPAIVVTAITACTGLTPGTGNVALYQLLPGATSLTADPNNTNVSTMNWYVNSGTIAVGKHCFVTFYDGACFFVTSDC